MTAVASASRDSAAETRDVPALTSLRMFAAWLVFVHHFPPATSGLWGPITRQGHVGVTVFFLLSGFLITVRYYRAWTEGRLRLRDYFKKRVARILPLYYVVLILSLLLSGHGLDASGRRLPEWTMTQGFFWESLYHAAIPTSWSLTVEECFYAVAPVVFLMVRTLGGLRRPWHWIVGLGVVTGVLWWAGLGLVSLSVRSGLADWYGLFATKRHMAIYTICGRFLDFAVGIACALFFLRVGAADLWKRRGGTLLAGLLGVLSVATLTDALVLMDTAGGIDGPGFALGWKYNVGVVLASAGTILALTCATALPTRVLALAPFVYFGKISYALYLVQLTPLGEGALLGTRLSPTLLHVCALYLAMNGVSALLFEGVEKPARRVVLRAADAIGEQADRWGPQVRTRLVSLPLFWAPRPLTSVLVPMAVVLALVGALIWSAVAFVMRHGGAPTMSEVQAAVPHSRAARPVVVEAEERGGLHRVRLPEAWQRTGRQDSAFLLFVGGTPVRVLLGEPEKRPDGPYAFSRGPRSSSVFVRCPEDVACADALVVRSDGLLWRIGLRRVSLSRIVLPMLVAATLLWLAVAVVASRRRPTLHAWLHGWFVMLLVLGLPLAQAAPGCTLVAVAVLGSGWLLVAARSRRNPPSGQANNNP